MRRYASRAARFSSRVLSNYAAMQLPEVFGLRAIAGSTEMLLYNEIGFWGVTAEEFVTALANIHGPITLRINSPGGDVFDGMAIFNALKGRTAPVDVIVDGLAASAASGIALAGNNLSMAEPSMLMIHKAWGLTIGNDDDHQSQAGILGKIDGQMAALYAKKSGASADAMLAAMKAETWYTAQEAKDAGLCDVVLNGEVQEQARLSARFAALVGAPNAMSRRVRAASGDGALPDYDPDGDGDNDAEEAMGHLTSACSLIGTAMDCLTGGVNMLARLRAAATEAEWMCDAAEDLPIDASDTWDGPAAQDRIFEWAGFNGNSPDPAKAKQAFLAWDHHNPNLKGSYKLPFADVTGGELKAVKAGIDASASRLPQTDIPADVKSKARDVLDAYESRMSTAQSSGSARLRLLRQHEAEAA